MKKKPILKKLDLKECEMNIMSESKTEDFKLKFGPENPNAIEVRDLVKL